jgi:hypothetical protein
MPGYRIAERKAVSASTSVKLGKLYGQGGGLVDPDAEG